MPDEIDEFLLYLFGESNLTGPAFRIGRALPDPDEASILELVVRWSCDDHHIQRRISREPNGTELGMHAGCISEDIEANR